jgi:hypothetical protein
LRDRGQQPFRQFVEPSQTVLGRNLLLGENRAEALQRALGQSLMRAVRDNGCRIGGLWVGWLIRRCRDGRG